MYTPSFSDTMICAIFYIKFSSDAKPTCSWFHVSEEQFSMKLIVFYSKSYSYIWENLIGSENLQSSWFFTSIEWWGTQPKWFYLDFLGVSSSPKSCWMRSATAKLAVKELPFVQNISVIVIYHHFCLSLLLSNRDHYLVNKELIETKQTVLYTHIYL